MRERIIYDAAIDRVVLSAGALASFAVKGRGIPFAVTNTSADITGVNVPLSHDTEYNGLSVRLCSAADCTAKTDAGDAVCMTVSGVRRTDRPKYRYAESAMLAITGYLWCLSTGNGSVILRMTLSSGSDETVYEYNASAEYLQTAVYSLISRAEPFIDHILYRGRVGVPAMKDMPFPYKEMRESQYDFINAAFRAIKSSSRLLVSAPTGTGKTISALYPAVRAVGAGIADKIFCLCSKTTVGKAFTDAAALLGAHVPSLTCTVISSKERCCPRKRLERDKSIAELCGRACPYFVTAENKDVSLRLTDAAAECLKVRMITADVIASSAALHNVCPHELSLLVSEYSDIVICDYNYVFDFRIRLRRYFGDITGDHISGNYSNTGDEKYIFLADEIHNLPGRAADMYSAELSSDLMKKLLTCINDLEEKSSAKASLISLISELDRMAAAALENGDVREIDGKRIRAGFVNSPVFPRELAQSAGAFRRTLTGIIIKYGSALPPVFSNAADALGKFCHVCSLFDERFTCFSSAVGDEFYVKLCCLDPSYLLDLAMHPAKAVVFFSATLTPISYYADILGCKDGAVLELDSPFPAENLCPVAVDSVSMKMSDRSGSADTVAECIAAAVSTKPGNYLAFFPSFDYMEKVKKIFRQISPETKLAVQSRKMGTAEREEYLSAFKSGKKEDEKSLVGFAVLGGIFSEGIDLPGNSLIGVIIAGTGMPQITSERNIMKEYFDRTREGGMEYAYIYPGFNNVLQAAGRVIRTKSDRGILILIDSRYSEPSYYRMFPKYWRHIKYTGDPISLEEILIRFWRKGS